MDKYWLFRALLGFMDDYVQVTYANTSNYCGNIEITGEVEGQVVKIEVSIEDKEAEE